MHCKYLPVVPYKALEKFSKALYGTTGRYLQCMRFPSCHDYAARVSAKKLKIVSFTKKSLCGLVVEHRVIKSEGLGFYSS